MLRRKIHHQEYIALTAQELPLVNSALHDLVFVIPEVTMRRGYYMTKMHPLNFGSINSINIYESNTPTISFSSGKVITVRTTNQFIRWLGL